MAKSHSFKNLEKALNFNKEMKTEKPIFFRFKENVRAKLTRTMYNGQEHLTAEMMSPENLPSTRRPVQGLTVELVQENENGIMKVAAECFISSPTFWFVGNGESRVTIPQFWGDDVAYATSLEAAEAIQKTIAQVAQNLGISEDKARAFIGLATADVKAE